MSCTDKSVQHCAARGTVFDLSPGLISNSSACVLACASEDSRVTVWQLGDTEPHSPAQYSGHTDAALRVAWAADGSLLASGQLGWLLQLCFIVAQQ